MSPTKNPRTRATEVRANLLSAARTLLEREGPSALTVRAVATEAGVAPMGVYNHFDGKDGLLDAVVTDGFRDFSTHIAAVDADASARLLASGHRYREFAVAHPRLYELMFSTECHADDEVAAAAFGVLVDIVRYGQAAGVIRDGDPVALAAQTWACVHGAVSLELTSAHPPFVDAAANYEDVLLLIARGLAP
ncbi:TetR/AcrR family transcriptional regulator [Gordonia sp. Z-3]|jgi:AcrR family transcriptional regulator|uniref:TetR/AcrR family transcriptional regulator n=2 Tax=Gordonia TaxID=2053 RepID=A0A9X3I681_9ACTN|nr:MULTISPECIES: TetR/AcrR family transcriptional regulator [Gordonia]MAU80893.1 TetR family transcriptional regulator [Gordonia sp. (in: high G+C Gram-positive bacteria)]MCF3937312.1 TetR/AcrR family transcriptional regulator [Gordonia tangerina]MCX2965790.1 TetR/AcrR family transcriptional regulator [Gordonia aquimaris]MED5802846.1 TetR/AcrR family transcriptional regulator [Gordonia sp. Z-3]